MGFYPHRGVLTGTPAFDQTTKLEAFTTSTYNAGTSNVLGTRVCAHRIYNSWSTITGQSCFAAKSDEWYSFMSGHVVILSTGVGPNPSSSLSFWGSVAAMGTTMKANYHAFFQTVEALPFGQNINTGLKDGNGNAVPGAKWGGTCPLEIVYVFTHEPNVPSSNSSNQNPGTQNEYAAAMKAIMVEYDTWCTNNSIVTKHLKFATIISNPDTSVGGAADGWHGLATQATTTAGLSTAPNTWNGTTGTIHTTAANITTLGTNNNRPVDYPGFDLYVPGAQVNATAPMTPSGEQSWSSKYTKLNNWRKVWFPNQPAVIGEYSNRFPTNPADPSYPPNWYSALITWLNANPTGTGDHPIKYMCQFESTSSNVANGASDNSIIPDQLTAQHSNKHGVFCKAGVSPRPSFNAYHDTLISLGNLTLSGTSGVTPTGLGSSGVTATQATLSWTGNGSDASYNIYMDGTVIANVSTTSTVVFPLAGDSRPVTHAYAVSGVGLNGIESTVSSSINVTYPSSGLAPGTPSGLTTVSITQTSAVISCSVPSGSPTGYYWYLDGSSTPLPYTTTPQVSITGLLPGTSHSVTVAAFNLGGTSTKSGSWAFTTPGNSDTTKPTAPTGVATSGSPAFNGVTLVWSASTDPPGTGQVVTGVQGYNIYRSNTASSGSGTPIGSVVSSVLTFTDHAPLYDLVNPTNNYYQVTAVDGAGNESLFSSVLTVSVPARPSQAAPIPQFIVTPASGSVQFGGTAIFDATSSIPGTGGQILTYAWSFGDMSTTSGGNAVVNHTYITSDLTTPVQFVVSLTVTDASNNVATVSQQVVVNPPVGGFLPRSNGRLMIKGQPPRATDVNSMASSLDFYAGQISDTVDALTEQVQAKGNPSSGPFRQGGAVWTSDLRATSQLPLAAGVAYVIRAWIADGSPFSQIKFLQVNASVSTVTNSFFALYDIAGNLQSPTGALTDASSLFMSHSINTYTFDGGPYDPPLGVDDPNNPTNEFFIYFYLGSVGATVPSLAVGSTYLSVNMGCVTTATAPTPANLETIPLFGTASNLPSPALNAPATLGNITALADAFTVGLY